MTTPRPRRKSPDERRAEITTTATSLAVRDGLTALTLRGIAHEMGVASSLVAHYEPSMEALTATTFRRVASDELAEITVIVEGRQAPLERLATLVSTLLDPEREAVSTVWADAWSLGRRLPLVAEAARDAMDAWHSLASKILRDGLLEGSVTTPDPDLAALELFALIDSTTAYALVGYRTPTERAEVVRRAVEQSIGLEIGKLATLG